MTAAIDATNILNGRVRSAALDGLRGLAILMVMFGHIVVYGAAHTYTTSTVSRAIGEIGATGVDLFFVLSGFLITGILYDTKSSPSYFRRFYIRRTLRIFPPYYAALLLIAIVYLLFPHWRALQPLSGTAQIANWTYTMNFLIAHRGWPAEPSVVGHFWSLCVEEQFYLIWPFVVWRLSRNRLQQLATFGILAALVIRFVFIWPVPLAVPNVLLPSRMDSLLVGTLICLQMRDGSMLPSWLASSWATGVALILFAVDAAAAAILVTGPRYPVFAAVHLSVVALVFGLLLCRLQNEGGIARTLLELKGFRFFGRYSYAMYIYHLPVIVVLAGYRNASNSGGILLFALIVLVVTTLLALLSWKLIEGPALRFKERVTRYETAKAE